MNKHQQIVLYCLHDSLADEIRAEMNSLTEGDWQQVISAADWLSVGPLMWGATKKLGITVPQNKEHEFQTILKNNAARNLKLLAEFHELAEALQAQNIPLMPLKGIDLCTNLYKNIGERVVGDIDLLVPLEDLRRAAQVVEGLGYRPYRPYDLKSEIETWHQLPHYSQRGKAMLELHWSLLKPPLLSRDFMQDIWERSIAFSSGNIKFRGMSTEDQLIYFCAHSAHHHFYQKAMRALFDVKILILQRKIDWTTIAHRARTLGFLPAIYLTLRLTDELLQCPLPRPVWEMLRPAKFTEELLPAAKTKIFEEPELLPKLAAIWGRQNFFQRVKGLWQKLALSPTALAQEYKLPPKSKKVYFYYFIRLFDLLALHGRDLLGLTFGDRKKLEAAASEHLLIDFLNQ